MHTLSFVPSVIAPDTKISALNGQQKKETVFPPVSIKGKTFFVIFHGDRFGEYLMLTCKKNQSREIYHLPVHDFEKTNKEGAVEYATTNFGGTYEWVSHQNGEALVVLRLISSMEENGQIEGPCLGCIWENSHPELCWPFLPTRCCGK